MSVFDFDASTGFGFDANGSLVMVSRHENSSDACGTTIPSIPSPRTAFGSMDFAGSHAGSLTPQGEGKHSFRFNPMKDRLHEERDGRLARIAAYKEARGLRGQSPFVRRTNPPRLSKSLH